MRRQRAGRMMLVACIAGRAGLSTAFNPSLSAQRPRQKTPGVPRNANEPVDLNAPVPRTLDGKPDLSGLWCANAPAGLPRVQVTPSPDSPPIATLDLLVILYEAWHGYRQIYLDGLAVKTQEEAGLDIVSDGEMRRESYSNRFATALEGIRVSLSIASLWRRTVE